MIKMTDVTNLPESILDIVKIFNRNDFRPLTLKEIADKMGLDSNTLNQRILRDKQGIFESEGKPKKIWIKNNIAYIVHVNDGFKCRICRKEFSMKDLTVQTRLPGILPDDDYNNLASVCKHCLEHPSPADLSRSVSSNKIKENWNENWFEYKQINLRYESYYETNNLHPNFRYFTFQEVGYGNSEIEEDNWIRLAHKEDSKETIASREIVDILNYFGKTGWEVLKIEDIARSDYDGDKIYPDLVPVYEIFFRRKMRFTNKGDGKE